jgi:hypothetical protein
VPAVVGEGGAVERRPLDRGPDRGRLHADHLDPQSRVLDRLHQLPAQRRPRVVQLPAVGRQDLPYPRTLGRVEVDGALDQDPALRIACVHGQPGRQLFVAERLRGDREAQHVRLVQQPDRQEGAVTLPQPDGGRGPLAAEPPEPAEIARMELDGDLVPLPARQRLRAPPRSSTAGTTPEIVIP